MSFTPDYRDSMILEDISRLFPNREAAERVGLLESDTRVLVAHTSLGRLSPSLIGIQTEMLLWMRWNYRKFIFRERATDSDIRLADVSTFVTKGRHSHVLCEILIRRLEGSTRLSCHFGTSFRLSSLSDLWMLVSIL